jgi:Ribosomal silencing factor during starvation
MSFAHSRQPLCRLISGHSAQSTASVCRYAKETPRQSWQRYIRNLSLAAVESPGPRPKPSRSIVGKPLSRDALIHTKSRLCNASPLPSQTNPSAIEELQNLASQPQSEPEQQLPWYLRSDSSTNVISSPSIELPPLPEDSPPLLQPILTYLSTARSPLFNLSIMDLRALDPSPALGSNLLMVLGTAKSSQHAHAFSDRFCRWLRSEHKLRPAPDGLLGRQQVKVWRRRAAKKVRAMALAGAGPGIEDRIGRDIGLPDWVCVHVGEIPATADVEVQSQSTTQDLTAFQRNTNTVTFVVHILTEDRRLELDLEGYWDRKLRRMEQMIEDAVEAEPSVR